MRHAGRNQRQRVERLGQIGLRQAQVLDLRHGRRQTDGMAGSAIATLVCAVVLVRMGTVVMHVEMGLGAVARAADRAVVRATMVMETDSRVQDDFHRHRRSRLANGHGSDRSTLKRYRKHHQPQKDRAKADHSRILVDQVGR